MRAFFVLLLLLCTSYADEIQRIDLILKDIEKLRSDYGKCSEMLEKSSSLAEENRYLQSMVEELQNIVKKQEKLLKTKEKQEKNQFFESKKCEQESGFPKLMMKNEPQEKQLEENEVITFEASAFRLKTDSFIYDAINGNSIGKWESGTSFTSNTMSGAWIKVSGYFVDRKWEKAQKEIWVKSAQVLKREQ